MIGRAVRLAAWAGVLVLPFAGAFALENTALRQEFETAISKRVARDRGGNFYVLMVGAGGTDPRSVALRRGPPGADSLADFGPPCELMDGIAGGEPIRAAGMAIDAQDRLHLVWTTGQGLSGYARVALGKLGDGRAPEWRNPADDSPGRLVLEPDASCVGDIALDSAGQPWVAWRREGRGHYSELLVGTAQGGRWRRNRAAAGSGLAPPSLMVGGASEIHLAWHDILEDSWILSATAAELQSGSVPAPWLIPRKAGAAGGYRPTLAALPDRRLLAVRENQYSQLESLVVGAAEPAPTRVGQSDRRFAADTLHSPILSRDRQGIPWLFLIDSARQHVFYARWLGSGWSPLLDAGWLTWNSARFEDNHLPIDRIAVEESASGKGSDLGILFENTSSAPRAEFRRILVPEVAAVPAAKILFLDLKEIASLNAIELKLNQPVKRGQVISAGQLGDFDGDRVGRFVRVLKEHDRFRMWYSAVEADPALPWWDWDRMGYAESWEGRKFLRKNLGLASFNGKADTNLIPGLARAMPAICFDPRDPDPRRRYKVLRFPNTGAQDEEAREGRLDPWDGQRLRGQLLVSGDGVEWTESPAVIDFPAGRPGELIPEAMLADYAERDPRKRYKLYGFSSLNLARRGGSYAFSPDAARWTAAADNPVLDPFVGTTPPVRGGKVLQIHDLMAWREGSYYLALYQYQHDAVNLDLRLAMSRDGAHFDCVQPEQPLIPAGGAGEWDRGMLTPAVPVADGKEIKIYYGATHYAGTEEAPLLKSEGGVGLATLRPDGFTDLQPRVDAAAGEVVTIPIHPGSATRLAANVDCGSGFVEAELVDPITGRPLAGYSKAESFPLTGDAAVRLIAWKNHEGLAGLSGDFQIRLFLHGQNGFPKLYSLQFQ